MQNKTSKWISENWGDLQRRCLSRLSRVGLIQRADAAEDAFQTWVTYAICKDLFAAHIESGKEIKVSVVSRFCVQYAMGVYMRSQARNPVNKRYGWKTVTESKDGYEPKVTADRVEVSWQTEDDNDSPEPVVVEVSMDPEQAVLWRESLSQVQSVVEGMDRSPRGDYTRICGLLAEGYSRAEIDAEIGKSTNAPVTRLRKRIRESCEVIDLT